ncbi:hypothetical protein [Vitreimonas flagellata]|uniref:hypothetical protein n=1 Tax=Vitreimonas flagellata TaxID=2560861 RepID=UPI00143157AA|nr:hypothetical protein [Vitreimonas flagellata]
MKALLARLTSALALAACTHAPPPAAQLFHYVRTNSDGSLPEQIWVYRPNDTRVEVVKIVQRCRRAAYVTSDLDLARNQPRALVGGRLARDGSQEPFAWLDYDRQTRSLAARIPSAQLNADITIQHEPWRIYDFDLSELTALNAGRPAPRADFVFNVVLIWPEEGAENPLRDLGLVNARFVGVEEHAGVSAVNYAVSGGLNGDLWLDARSGHVVEARFNEPNHLEYRDFRLVLQSVTRDAADEWREVRLAHWRDCPENE